MLLTVAFIEFGFVLLRFILQVCYSSATEASQIKGTSLFQDLQKLRDFVGSMMSAAECQMNNGLY